MSSIIPPLNFAVSFALLNTLSQRQLVRHPHNPPDNSSPASHHWSLSLQVDLRSLLTRDIVPTFPLSSMVHLDKGELSSWDHLMFVCLVQLHNCPCHRHLYCLHHLQPNHFAYYLVLS